MWRFLQQCSKLLAISVNLLVKLEINKNKETDETIFNRNNPADFYFL